MIKQYFSAIISPMQGYIINTTKVKDEDLLVTILTKNRVKTLYRFYGSRHPNIHLGYKIDFEAHPTNKSNLFLLRNVTNLTYKWMFEREKFYIWQQFLKLLYNHLKDIENIDNFYFDMLGKMTRNLIKENPKRVIIEAYISLLEHEGRLHKEFECFLCSRKIEKKVILTRAYLPACSNCIKKNGFDIKKVSILFETKNSILLNENEIESLYALILEGL